MWEILDWVVLGGGFVYLAWFWITSSRTTLNPAYPNERRREASLHLAKGSLVAAVVCGIVLLAQHIATGSP